MSKQQIILVTGATAGIGRHAALHLVRLGHHVIASGRRRRALAELAATAELERGGGRLDTLQLDVTDADSIAAAQARVAELTGGRGLDVLINNAGYGLAAPVVEASDEDVRAQFETNVFGLLAVTRAFVPAMIERGGGRVINVSSVGGQVTFPLMGVYHASKYAVEALSDALRNELAPFGIHVVIIEPGPIQSEFASRIDATAEAYRANGSAYQPVFARHKQLEERTMSMAAGPEPIARAIARAIDARRPRARYVAPLSSRVLLAVLRVIPTFVLDAFVRAALGLRRQRLRAAPTPLA